MKALFLLLASQLLFPFLFGLAQPQFLQIHPNSIETLPNCTFSNCLKCNQTTCTLCSPGYYLANTSSCISCDFGCSNCKKTGCQACQPGFIFNNAGICESCSEHIKFCDLCDSSGLCKSCQDGYYPNAYGTCVSCGPCATCSPTGCSSCSVGYYYDQQVGYCEECSLGCNSCSSFDNCQVCDSSYYLDSDGHCDICLDSDEESLCNTDASDSNTGNDGMTATLVLLGGFSILLILYCVCKWTKIYQRNFVRNRRRPRENFQQPLLHGDRHISIRVQRRNGISQLVFSNANINDPLTPEEMALLTITKLSAKTLDSAFVTNHQCSICFEDYVPGTEVIYLACAHFFHAECLKQWLTQAKGFCPYCKKSVRSGLGGHN